MPSYDAAGFHPPAPTALVTLYDLTTAASLPGVPMLLDIGSDVTPVPRAAIERLGVVQQTDPSIELIGFDGTRSVAPFATVLVILLRRAYRGRYMLVDGESGIRWWRSVIERTGLNHSRTCTYGELGPSRTAAAGTSCPQKGSVALFNYPVPLPGILGRDILNQLALLFDGPRQQWSHHGPQKL